MNNLIHEPEFLSRAKTLRTKELVTTLGIQLRHLKKDCKQKEDREFRNIDRSAKVA